ncbi:MAG: hypothetical protein R3E01_20395 [Pirellulaceae bacterium]
MNVFVLSTGRCGSTTFVKACQHIRNFSCGHETRAQLIGEEHFDYPPDHIESDNRLSWFLGDLDQRFGKDAFFVHLTRDRDYVAQSYARRMDIGILNGYARGILMEPAADLYSSINLARDYCDTVNHNIEMFLKDKPHRMDVRVESVEVDFRHFWDWIGATGDLDAALAEWDTPHNATGNMIRADDVRGVAKVFRKLGRIVTKLPHYIRYA